MGEGAGGRERERERREEKRREREKESLCRALHRDRGTVCGGTRVGASRCVREHARRSGTAHESARQLQTAKAAKVFRLWGSSAPTANKYYNVGPGMRSTDAVKDPQLIHSKHLPVDRVQARQPGACLPSQQTCANGTS